MSMLIEDVICKFKNEKYYKIFEIHIHSCEIEFEVESP